MEVTQFVFELLALKANIKGVSVVTSNVKNITTTFSPKIGHSFNNIIVASTDKQW